MNTEQNEQAVLRVLLLEDDPVDAELAMALLRQAGYCCQHVRVETRDAFVAQIEQECYDLVLADYQLPAFDGLAALRLVRAQRPDLPFILISGLLSEEQVIDALKAGATDYVLKDRMARLPPVVGRALQERAEYQQRQRAEQRYRELFENAGDLLYTQGVDGALTSVNRAFERLTGYRRESLLGSQIDELVAPEFRPFWLGVEAHQQHGDAEVREVEFLCEDGRRLPVEVDVRLIREGPKVVGVQGSARDMSERRRAEAERRRLEAQVLEAQRLELIGRLAGGIAHDFNNVLTAIIGNTHLALESTSPDDERAEYLAEIDKFAGRAASLTRQLLAFSRRQPLERRAQDLNAIVTDLLTMLERLLGPQIDVQVDLAPSLPNICADHSQLEQVLLNLAVNARDAMPDGGRLRISTRTAWLDELTARTLIWVKPGHYVELSVTDTGHGIAHDTLLYIFEPFFSTKHDGTGLGLAVVYGIVKHHDGGIQVTSEPGDGTTFTIFLPVQPERAE